MKKQISTLLNWTNAALMACLVLAGTACSDDEGVAPDKSGERFYSLSIISGDVSYILPTNTPMEGTVSPVGSGVEFGGRSFIPSGNYVYDFNEADKKFYQYELNSDGTVEEVASILATQYISDRAYSRSLIDENTLLIMDPVAWGDPETKWFTIALPEFTVSGSGSINLPTLGQSPGVSWKMNVGRVAKHGDKLIMGSIYYDFDGNYSEGSHAVVFDWPGMTNPTLIHTDQINAELGIISGSGYAETENGDLYISASGGAFWGKSGSDGKSGGILRIKNGETDFDEGYLLDLSDELGKPTNIMQLDYIGNDIAIAMLFDPTEVDGWGDIDNDHYYFAKINLVTKEITPYNIPKSGSRLARQPLIDNGKYYTYLKMAAANTTHVLEIDPQGGPDAFTRGAQIVGDNVQGYAIAKHPAE
jgi:hypothetical protein